MSLLNKASLIQIPSGYKDGTLYSAKPTNGDGDFTFSRGSNLAATRVNSEGLIEKGRENLLLQSNTFDTTWTQVRADYTSGQTGYDGTSDAWQVECNANGYSGGYQNTSSINQVNCSSLYAKAGNVDYLFISATQGSTNNAQYFNLTNGTLGSLVGTGIIDANIESVGNGWYRCSIAMSPNASFGYFLFGLSDTDGNSTGAIGEYIYIQDAQLEVGLVATDYIPTTTTTAQAGILEDMPRLDYSGGASCPSLLLEPQRSNLVTYSEYFGGYGQINTSVITNETTSLEGLQNATLVSATGTGQHYIQSAAITYTSSTTYTYSVFAKKSNTSLIQLLAPSGPFGTNAFASYNFDTLEVTEGSSATASMEDYGNGWYRLILTCTSTGSALVSSFYLVFTDDKSVRVPSFTSSGEEVYCYGAMLEEASYPTSYIPTYGSSVTRNRDNVYNTSADDILNDAQGTLFLEVQGIADGGDSRRLTISDGSASNRVIIELDASAGIFEAFISSGGTTIGSLNKSGDDQLQNKKIALTYDNSAFKMFINGVLEDSTSISQTPIGLDSIVFANGNNTSFHMYGKVSQCLYIPTALSNEEAIALTTI